MRLYILLFVLFSLTIAQEHTWDKFSRDLVIEPRKFGGLDFSTIAKEIKYKVSCSLPCDLYMMVYPEFQKFQKNDHFNYLRFKSQILSDQVTWTNTSDISKRVVVVIVNIGNTDESISAKFELEQLIPQASKSFIGLIIAIIGIVVVLCLVIVLLPIVFGICKCCCDFGGYFIRKPSGGYTILDSDDDGDGNKKQL